MDKRISIKNIEPEGYQAMMALENYSKTVQINPKLRKLINIRASQLNGCAYCIDMHTERAVKLGEIERRLSAWKESHLFSEEERLILQMTEEVTLINLQGLPDVTYNSVVNFFGEKITAQILMQIVFINSWNRIAVSTKMIYKPF